MKSLRRKENERLRQKIETFAKEHTIKECAEKYGYTYGSMANYLSEHKIVHLNSNIKHNMCYTRLHRIWAGMKARCKKQHKAYSKNYGDRGIKVCEDWKNSFDTFRDWALANGYTDKLSIDRIDVNGDYTPQNCRWADSTTQQNNTRTNHLLTYKGETRTLSQWARAVGLDVTTLHKRLKAGWSVDKALTRPLQIHSFGGK